MAYRSSSISSATGGTRTSLTVAVPAGVQADDIVFLIGNHDGNTGSFTWPAGFTQLDSSALASPDGQLSAVAWKRLTGADSGTYTVSFGDTFAMVIAVAFSGRHTTDAPTNSKATSTSNNSSPVTVTASTVTAVAGDDLLWISAPDIAGSSATSHTPPSGYTERQDGQDVWSVVSAATLDNVSAGATGSVAGSFTGQSGGWTAYLIRIPAAAGGGTTTRRYSLSLTGVG